MFRFGGSNGAGEMMPGEWNDIFGSRKQVWI